MVPQAHTAIFSPTPPGPADKSGDFSLTAKKSAARRVLVVDDESLVRWMVGETLGEAGYDVIDAADGQSALTAMAATPDVVLLDLRLPDSQDLRILTAMRRLAPATPIILMTAYGSPEIVGEAMRQGAFSLLTKPFDILELAPLVARALASRPM